jgi:hypothetical protein
MRIAHLLTALLALLACTSPALAQTKAQSSPEDRQRFIAIVHNLEAAPLNPRLREDRAWAMRWLTAAPDVTVSACLEPLGGVTDKNYAYSSEIVVQYMFAMAVFILENPAKSGDPDAEQLAGVEGALKAYQALRTAKPGDKSSALDKLLGLQGRGELPGFVQKAHRSCMAKS